MNGKQSVDKTSLLSKCHVGSIAVALHDGIRQAAAPTRVSIGEMKLRLVLTVIAMVFLTCNSAEAKAWRGIEPLHSTRADVERLFGSKVVRCGGSACIYELADEIVFVLYAKDSDCKNDDATTAWRVPAGTVIEIGVRFKEDKPLSLLEFDLSTFERVEDKHLPGWIYYVNLDEGVRVEGGLKTASSVTYFQSAKDNYLHCPSINKPKGQPANLAVPTTVLQHVTPSEVSTSDRSQSHSTMGSDKRSRRPA